MKITRIPIMISFLTVTFLFSVANSYAQDQKIDQKKVPVKVLTAFHKAYPNGKIKGTSIEKENGHGYYEIESVEGTKHRDMLITHSGKIKEVETTIPENELPAPVMKTLKAKYKELKINKAEQVKSGGKVTYELSFKSNNKMHRVVILPDGKIVKSASAEKENEKGENEKNDND